MYLVRGFIIEQTKSLSTFRAIPDSIVRVTTHPQHASRRESAWRYWGNRRRRAGVFLHCPMHARPGEAALVSNRPDAGTPALMPQHRWESCQ